MNKKVNEKKIIDCRFCENTGYVYKTEYTILKPSEAENNNKKIQKYACKKCFRGKSSI